MRISLLMLIAMVLVSFAPATAARATDFESQVLPILDSRCFECHREAWVDSRGRPRKPKAGLRLDGKHWILQGSSERKVLTAGSPDKSPMYKLTILAEDDADIMPAKGDPLTKQQTDTLRNWIEEGADFGDWVGAAGPDVVVDKPEEGAGDEIGKDLPARLRIVARLAKAAPPASDEALAKAKAARAEVTHVIPGGPLLRVDFPSARREVTDKSVDALAGLSEQITWLDLSRTRITDNALAGVAKMKRLTRLDLHETSLTDAALTHLAGLPELRTVNLYGTSVTDGGLVNLGRLSKLEAVYLWGSKVTPGGAEALRSLLPKARVHLEAELPGPSGATQEGSRRR